MKRTRFARRSGLDRDAEQLARLARGLAASTSRIEDSYWQEHLSQEIDRLLRAGNEEALSLALEHLYNADGHAYDELADLIEARTESGRFVGAAPDQDVVMFAAPLLAWSRFVIPSGPIPASTLAAARVQLQAHVLAAGAKLALADFLFSPDQLPRGYVETYRFASQLAKQAGEGHDLHLDPSLLPETTRFISDTRYIVGAVAAPHGHALFRWQEEDSSREAATTLWQAQGGGALQTLFTGCALELQLPDAYHAACRNADRGLRVYALHAAVAFLQTTLNVSPASLRAVVAPFFEERVEEFRIGFTLNNSSDVVHGVVWPLLGAEDEGPETVAQIEAVLRATGVSNIIMLEHRFPLEFCDDCGMPMFPTPEGETMHAELPEESTPTSAHLH